MKNTRNNSNNKNFFNEMEKDKQNSSKRRDTSPIGLILCKSREDNDNDYIGLSIHDIYIGENENFQFNYNDSGIFKNKNKWKTEICHHWEIYGYCKFGESCCFAHGEKELKKRKMTANYKTKPCKHFFDLGYCPYGSRCQFSHKKEIMPNFLFFNNKNNNEVSYLKILSEFLSPEKQISHELVKRPRLMTFESIFSTTSEESENSKLQLYNDIINIKKKGNSIEKNNYFGNSKKSREHIEAGKFIWN